jgi:hypothetical protein
MTHGENYIMMNFIACILHQILLGLLIKEDEVGRTCGMHGEGRSVYRVLVGSPTGKRSLVRPRCRWETGIDGVHWIQLAQDRVQWQNVVNMVMNLWVP